MSLSLPIQLSPTRAGGLSPEINLSYDSGLGNGPFGFGWNVGLASVHRKTKDGVPVYVDNLDAFGMGGTDIVPALETDGKTPVKENVGCFEVTTYKPRVDSGAMRIEKWTRHADTSDVHWRAISAENVTSIYGLNDESRIMSKSAGRRQVATWLLCRSFDGRGNAMEYIYKPEDGVGLGNGNDNGLMPVWERNRTQESRCHQKYIKRILYGNRTPCRDLDNWKATDGAWPRPHDWMFEVVFDYGEHDMQSPGTVETQIWGMRQDPFSQNNLGFELRTYRLCRRILMFHHFPKETGWPENLVASSDLGYQESPQATFLSRYTANRHVVESGTSESDTKDGAGKLRYKTESFPPWTFDYTKTPSPNQMKTAQANVANLLEIPQTGSGLCEWLDLNGEGIPGLLTRVADGTMSYQQNKGKDQHQGQPHTETSSSPASEPQFSAPACLPLQPTLGRSTSTGRFEDLGHSGRLNLVHMGPNGEPEGYWERDDSDSWSVHSEYPPTPGSEFDKGSDQTISIDLTGDGLTDVLYATGDSQELVWEQNLGKQGHTACRRTLSFASTDQPRLGISHAIETQTFVADMTGDGLADLVEISQASIKFWPNQGHGRFGAVVEMGSPPVFACGSGESSVFDPDRLRLIDVDGNGLVDVLYLLPGGGAHVYFNQAGNSWSKSRFLRALPATALPSSVFTLDLFGQGFGCLCWADASTSSGEYELRYIDLMGGTKPHLLRQYRNGFGSVTTVSYQPSTNFYLRDRQSGTPWSSTLPFPVQCLSQVTVEDQITGNSTTTRYAYRNGHYDPKEKSFAGFEMVEQWKTEKIILGKDEVYEPPTLHTKSWFGTGRGLTVDASRLFSPSALSSELRSLTDNNDNLAEGFQALKGSPLRTEVYNVDGTSSGCVPHSVEELSYDIKQLQPKGPSKHAVFQVAPRSSLTTVYGGRLEDPRVSHAIVLKTNDFGDVEESLTVVYPRSKRFASSALDGDDDVRNQTVGNASHDRVWFTNADGSVKTGCWVRPVAWRHQDYEIVGFKFPDLGILDVNEMRQFDFGALPEARGAGVTAYPGRALRSEEKTVFLDDNLSAPLDDGKIQAFSVVDKSYSLAFESQILSKIRANQERCGVLDCDVEELMSVGGYVKLGDADTWWAPSAHVRFRSPDGSFESELTAARRTFYSPAVYVDPFNNSSTLSLDGNLLLAERVQDAMGGEIKLENDYQHLQPVVVTDQNGIVQSVALDTLGHTACSAILGKSLRSGDEEPDLDVDSLDNIHINVTEEDVERVLRDPCGSTTRRLLGNAGSRVILALDRPSNSGGSVAPALIIGIARDLSFRRSDSPTLRINVTYLDGHGAPIQSLELNDPAASEQRWVVSGIAVSDGSDQVVRTYDPFFVSSPDFITTISLDKPGSTTFFDAVGRQVGALTPDGVWSKTIHSPWSLTEHDFGSMGMCAEPERDPHVGHFFSRIKAARYLPTWLQSFDTSTGSRRQDLTKSSVYFGTTTTTHLGSCGLPIRSAHAEPGKTFVRSRSLAYDVSGNKLRDFDALGRLVEKNVYDKLHRRVLCSTMDAGDIGTIFDVNGAVICSWNSRGVCFLYQYDALRRETRKLLADGAEPAVVITAVYGDSAPPAVAAKANLRGKLWKVHDQSGLHVNDRFDIRGNAVESSFFLANEYKSTLDWKIPDRVPLAQRPFQQTTACDNFRQIIYETDAKGNQTSRTFSRLGHVVRVEFHHAELEEAEPCLLNATFAADGLPLSKTYNNGVLTRYTYDDLTRRLTREQSLQKVAAGRLDILQDLSHVYDCVGRRIRSEDAAEQTQYFRGCAVGAKWEYSYDAVGQLTEAWGRGQLPTGGKGQGGRDVRLAAHDAMGGSTPAKGTTDGTRLYRYCESYTYDMCGNITSMTHAAPEDPFVSGWRRRYHYEEPSSLADDGRVKSNRLSRTTVGDTEDKYAYAGGAGLVGCITTLPRFSLLQWNFDNMLAASSGQDMDPGTPQMTYYVYDYAGRRVRKVTEFSAVGAADGSVSNGSPRKMRDTLYLDGVEIQLRMANNSSSPPSARTIARVTGDPGEVLSLVESSSDSDEILERYQIGYNLELDDEGQLITYEEYSPFGTVTYTATHQAVEAPRSYRFARYEHDRETGLYHCGSRYYCPWLGRWTSPDPLQDVDGPNVFVYCGNDPVGLDDHRGTTPQKSFIIRTVRKVLVQPTEGINVALAKKDNSTGPMNNNSTAAIWKEGHDLVNEYGLTFKEGKYKAAKVNPNGLDEPSLSSKSSKPGQSSKMANARNVGNGSTQNQVNKIKEARADANTHVMRTGMKTAKVNFLQKGLNTLTTLHFVVRGDVQDAWNEAVGKLWSEYREVDRSLRDGTKSHIEKANAMHSFINSLGSFGRRARSDDLVEKIAGLMPEPRGKITYMDERGKVQTLDMGFTLYEMQRFAHKYRDLGGVVENRNADYYKSIEGGGKQKGGKQGGGKR